METFNSIKSMREALGPLRRAGKRIALVPTMGNLHAGHISLVNKALDVADVVITSIFVNPMQFGPNEDLDRYPRTLEADKQKLEAAGNHLLFSPAVEDIYPNGLKQTTVHVPGCTECLCGERRPGHFDGVTTVVTKLFNMIQPDVAIFGQKDYQQLTTIRKMVAELCFPIEIIGVKTCREADNLAMSSRNGYLTSEERVKAVKLFAALNSVKNALISGDINYPVMLDNARQLLDDSGLSVDYLEIRDADSLKIITENSARIVVLGAAYLGNTRLIDNLVVELNTPLV